jgi:hypothetical protein
VEPVTGPAWLLWPPVGRLAGDRNAGADALGAPIAGCLKGRLQADAAMNCDGGPGQDPAVGRRRGCHGPGDQHVRRRLEAVAMVRPDTAPSRRVRWVSDHPAARAKTYLNVALTHLAEAVRLAWEAGRYRPADTLARLAGDATRALAELQAAPQTTPVDQAADNDDQAADP